MNKNNHGRKSCRLNLNSEEGVSGNFVGKFKGREGGGGRVWKWREGTWNCVEVIGEWKHTEKQHMWGRR